MIIEWPPLAGVEAVLDEAIVSPWDFEDEKFLTFLTNLGGTALRAVASQTFHTFDDFQLPVRFNHF